MELNCSYSPALRAARWDPGLNIVGTFTVGWRKRRARMIVFTEEKRGQTQKPLGSLPNGIGHSGYSGHGSWSSWCSDWPVTFAYAQNGWTTARQSRLAFPLSSESNSVSQTGHGGLAAASHSRRTACAHGDHPLARSRRLSARDDELESVSPVLVAVELRLAASRRTTRSCR